MDPMTDVLIVGAGPTGMVLALWLARRGRRLRIVDMASGPGTTSRALGVQPRTLEFYRQLGLAEAVMAKAYQVPAFNFWAEGRRRGRIPFPETIGSLTRFPSVTIFPQDAHERLLEAALAEAGVVVERGVELVGFEQDGSSVRATLRGADGAQEACAARYLAGCDGAHSVVRRTLGIDFPGGTYDRFFYVADIEADGPAMDGEIHINLDTAADFLAVFPLAPSKRARLVGTVLDDRPGRREELTFDDVSTGAVARLAIEVEKVNWFSTYRVHHRVAERFKVGRAFLLGDAGHIHSPAGGQGMNTGIGDAVNLAWKLDMVLTARAGEELLESYEAERIGFARRLVATTDRVFTLATSENPFAQLWRTRVAPVLVPAVNRIPAVRRASFRAVSQLALNYRGGALSAKRAGGVRGGDRMPHVAAVDNLAPLRRLDWQVQLFGCATPGLEHWCREEEVALDVLPWGRDAASAGLRRDAAYLVRPDGHVAAASVAGDPDPFARVFARMRP